jgi:hypothetical protein
MDGLPAGESFWNLVGLRNRWTQPFVQEKSLFLPFSSIFLLLIWARWWL